MNKRMEKEFADISNNPPKGVSIKKGVDQTKWEITITGPEGSVYHGHNFKVICNFPENYPFKMPDFAFETMIWHPNVTDKGEVCKEMLGEKEWVPTKQVKTIIEIIASMLAEPNVDSAINNEAAKQYKTDPKEFEKKAKEFINQYCKK
ncbi:hypothetical protein ABPG72_018860 [Tetrahymena utriculariae]